MNKRRTCRLAVRVSESEKRELDKLAATRDVPASWVIRQAIKQAVVEAGEAAR
jgi:predicted transcriptional regulator